MGFRIYFVSMTRLSLQIKSKLIFLTATWAHPAGVCRASCVPLRAGTRDRSAAAWWRPERFQREDSRQARRKQQFIFCKEEAQTGPLWPQRLSGRNSKEPIWTHILSLPLMEVSDSGVVRSLSQQILKQSPTSLFVSGEKFWLFGKKKFLFSKRTDKRSSDKQLIFEKMKPWKNDMLAIYPSIHWLTDESFEPLIHFSTCSFHVFYWAPMYARI